MKVRIVHVPFYDNTRLWLPGAIVEIASGVAFNGACMEKVEPDSAPPAPLSAPEPVAPQIRTPQIETPAIDPGVTAAALRKREYRKRKREQTKAARKKRDAPSVVTAPPAADVAMPAALLESFHSLPLCGVRKGEVPSSHEGDGVDPLRHRETVTPPPLTGEESDSTSTPPSGNESAASPAPSGAEGEGSAAQDTSAPPNLT